jgi:ribosome biogenesis GTPase
MMEFQNIGTVICFNKSDISTDEEANKLSEIYTQAGYKVIVASVEKGEGVEKVKNQLHGKTTVFAGPSGVGKSSMLNALASDYKMETGEVSKKIGRGKHTTRHSEIFYIDKETYVIDTPGFTSLDVPGMDERVLEECFPEFISSIGKCKFTGCAHMSEPDCEIKRLVEEGSISAGRYENYKSFYEELKNRKKY